MRAALAIAVLGLAFLAAVLWATLPAVAGGLVGVGLAASGFSGRDTTVTVRADPPLELLMLRADEVAIHSTEVRWHGMTAATARIDLSGVDLGSRQAAAVDGVIEGATLDTTDGVVAVAGIRLLGPTSRIVATLTLDPGAAIGVARTAVARRIGSEPTSVSLVAGSGIAVTVGGRTLSGRLLVGADGSIVADLGAAGRIAVVTPSPGSPIRFHDVAIEPDGSVVIQGILDPSALGLA